MNNAQIEYIQMNLNRILRLLIDSKKKSLKVKPIRLSISIIKYKMFYSSIIEVLCLAYVT